jgi:hypothetical protein
MLILMSRDAQFTADTVSDVPLVIAGPRRPAGNADFLAADAASVAAAAEPEPSPCTPPSTPEPIAAGAVTARDVPLVAAPAMPLARTLRTSSPRIPKLAGVACNCR